MIKIRFREDVNQQNDIAECLNKISKRIFICKKQINNQIWDTPVLENEKNKYDNSVDKKLIFPRIKRNIDNYKQTFNHNGQAQRYRHRFYFNEIFMGYNTNKNRIRKNKKIKTFVQDNEILFNIKKKNI